MNNPLLRKLSNFSALSDEESQAVIDCCKDVREVGAREDVIAQRDAIAAWARISYGWMGRSPDYKAAFLNTLGANAEFYGKFADNARAWHKRAQEAVLYLNHALVNPPIDRNKPVEQALGSADQAAAIARSQQDGLVLPPLLAARCEFLGRGRDERRY